MMLAGKRRANAALGDRACRQRGLTLLELLLTVVIFSLVITVFSQAMFQIGLFERASARGAAGWQRQWVSGFGVDDFFHGLVLAPEAAQPPASGSAGSFSAWWLEQADADVGRPVPVTLSVHKLESKDAPTTAAWGMFMVSQGGAAIMLARWEQEVSFQFMNSAGEVFDVWPPLTSAPETVTYEALPRAVQVVDRVRRSIVHRWVFAGLTQTGLAQASLRVPFGLGVSQ
ncbi:MAG: prepilin-type N-terminal cleavage/methylation domain-containing protein [Rhodoferax sp.]|uniref:prepilin-type N-terminal cleavage/methylation domain-containing protein n=1 Tax=Rhodoferax sp. TaxID=50421 RepID=UPI002634643D|nr:prepilin-type N-terminal cleavage/methylation domain-containing protein [Rhodoferax sp.]MDD5333689.1 prepilin-type N-terminal cleavage/methylation domain-containing protein [Rhodoferax sp.]